MTKSGGKGKGRQKKGDDLGRALIKMHINGTGKLNPRHANANMISILDNNALDDFIDSADMEGKDFEVKRVHQNHAFLLEATTHKSIQTLSFSAFKHEQLSIPRKPAWNKNMSAEDVDRNEKNAFLEWRREIAAIESNDDYTKKVTPFEKNLEVWRQLWRVCERSDLVVQIVDARNPLLYYTKDLMRYVSEISPPKKMLLLVNKADFLTEYQRLVWAQYFNAIGVRFAFYSAHIEQSKLDAYGLVEDFDEQNDVNEEEILWLAKDIVENYSLDIGKNAENVVFDRTAADKYVASELSREKEAAAVLALQEQRERPQTIPEEHEESDEEDDDDEDEDDSGDDSGEKTSSGSEIVKVDDNRVVKEEKEQEEEQDDGDDEDNFAAYVQKTVGRRLQSDSAEVADADDSEAGEEREEEEGGDALRSSEAAESSVVGAGPQAATVVTATPTSLEQRRARLLTRNELLLLLETVTEELRLVPQAKHDGRICIGLVGYPNVGKSSCINTLLGVAKGAHGKVRVGVSSTPGKTKHFQTLVLSDTVMLCDCPGLVFPSFMNSTGEMLCAGILPINQMKDYQEPAAVIASRIPQYLLEASMGIKIFRHLDPLDKKDRPPTPAEMLCSYCESRGYITNGTGRWDEFRACKDMLVWYTDGKLLNVAMPPFVNLTASTAPESNTGTTTGGAAATDIVQRWIRETERVMARRARVAERVAEQKTKASAAAIALEASREAAGLVKSDMVFDFTPQPEAEVLVDANGYEFVEESSDEEQDDNESQLTSSGKPKRDHKRLKTWGKKNRKLRNNDPYADVNSLVAYSTNRAKGPSTPLVTTGREKESGKLMRHSTEHAYGTAYVRSVMPHHTDKVTPAPKSGQKA